MCCIIFQIVKIDHNPIEYIDPRAFQGLTELKVLIIYSHKMKDTLKLISGGNSLIELKLNNVPEEFANMELQNVVVLETLYMTRGWLTIIPKNIQYIAGTLCSLSLSYNHIDTLVGMYNITFVELRYLHLSYNKISKINAQLLQLPRLRKIYLENNKLKQLEDMRFSTWGIKTYGMVSINMEENPWHCNESMKVLIETLCLSKGFAYLRREPLGMGLGLSDMVCESPPDVNGDAFSTVFQRVIQELDSCPGG